MHGIIHTASPFDLDLKRYTDFKDPAVRGSLNLLHAATESAGPQLRCVVFTSSVVTLLDPRKSPDYVFSEVDVGDYFEQEVERLGSAAPSRMFYVASKVAAEKAVWQYRRDFQVRSSGQRACAKLTRSPLAVVRNLYHPPRSCHRP